MCPVLRAYIVQIFCNGPLIHYAHMKKTESRVGKCYTRKLTIGKREKKPRYKSRNLLFVLHRRSLSHSAPLRAFRGRVGTRGVPGPATAQARYLHGRLHQTTASLLKCTHHSWRKEKGKIKQIFPGIFFPFSENCWIKDSSIQNHIHIFVSNNLHRTFLP